VSATYPDDMGEVVTASSWMNPAQISVNVLTPGVEVSVVVAYPGGESWSGTLRNTTVRKRHGIHDIGDGRRWCPACNGPADQCKETEEIRRRIANLDGGIDE